MKSIMKLSMFIFSFVLVASVFGQDAPKTMKNHKMMSDSCTAKTDSCMMMKNHKMMDHDKMMKDHKMMHHDKMMKDGGMKGMHSVVRKGVIDVESIDANKDGKVFQDVMDWNVISDEPGNCPICEMKLKEVTIEKAKENLVKHGFKVK